ncbi:NADH-quinone oxidoreductase subunit M [Burkholderiales bacterium]|nr:NADH-quinone oxidoreductase subunit M [Burkholderiales bacterium]
MIGWLGQGMPHLIAAPILLPLFAAALMVAMGERRRAGRALVNVLASLLGLAVAVALLVWVDGEGVPGVYLAGNWPVPFGIALVVDRLSALMLVLAGVLGAAAVLYSTARWDRAGVHFHPLFQLQLMGLNGAFLTADLFNLFVFFEVMLAASYGLLLHGSGTARVRAGLHYIAINLLASSVFLIGVSMLYGVTGTLNMADMAQKLAAVPASDRGLLNAAVAILSVAFLAKAAMWPLGFWLAPAYAAASAPAAALFAIMTKVGIYAVLRVWTLFFAGGDDASAAFGSGMLVVGGLATLAFGALGVMASQRLGRLAGFSIVVSSGTLLAATGLGLPALTGGALYYLASTTLAVGAFYLLIELVERARAVNVDAPEPDDDTDHLPFALELVELPQDVNLDDDEHALVGKVFPAAIVFLGIAFIGCALLIAGLPPLSGFVAKFGMLSALLNPGGLGDLGATPVPVAGWVLVALLIGSGLVATISLARAGIRYFWAPQDRPAPRLRVVECLPIAALLFACAALTVRAEPVLRYAQDTALALHRPSVYIDAVMSARPVTQPSWRPEASAKEGGT